MPLKNSTKRNLYFAGWCIPPALILFFALAAVTLGGECWESINPEAPGEGINYLPIVGFHHGEECVAHLPPAPVFLYWWPLWIIIHVGYLAGLAAIALGCGLVVVLLWKYLLHPVGKAIVRGARQSWPDEKET